MMLNFMYFILTFCWRWIWIKPSNYVARQLRRAKKSFHAEDAKGRLQLAQLFNISSKSEYEQNEILNNLNVNKQFSAGFAIRYKAYAGYTSLHFAVEKKDLNLTNKLLDLGASVLIQEYTCRYTPVHVAFNKVLKTETDIFNKEGRHPESELVNILLSAQVTNKKSSIPSSIYNLSHLHIACIVNHVDALQFLIDSGHCVNQSVWSRDQFNKYTCLHFAVRYSATEAVHILLNYGADIHRQNAKGISPLHALVSRLIDVNDFVRIGKRTRIEPYKSEMKRLESIAELFLVNRKSNINIDHISNVTWKISRAYYYHFIDDTGLSSLHLACMLPDILPVEYFLKWYDDMNLCIKSESESWPGWTPLHFAACCNTETFKLLLQRGADVSIKNKKGETALDLFLQRFNLESNADIINYTLSGIMLSDNSTKLSDLLLASCKIDSFKTFLQNLPDVNMNVSLDSPLWPGFSIMHLVILMNEKTKPWKDFKKKTFFEKNLDTLPELYNCKEEEEKLYRQRIKCCLEIGCSIVMKNIDDKTPLHLAFTMHKAQVVDKFLENCQDNVTDHDGLSHFHIACATGKVDVIKQFIDEGVDINCRAKNSFEWYKDTELHTVEANSSPLHIAVTFKHTEVVSLLLEKCADVYAKDSNDSTPIHLSKKLNLRSIAELLLEKTPDLQEALDKEKTSHLQVAVYADNEVAVTNLLNNTSSLLPADKKTLQNLALEFKSNKAYRELLKVSNENEEINYNDLDVWQPIAWPLLRKLKRQKWRDPKVPLDPKSRVTLLHLACAKFDIIWVKKLLRKGADVNAKIKSGLHFRHTPLYRLVEEAAKQTNAPRNLTNLVELLIKKGADVTIFSYSSNMSQTPIHRISFLLGSLANPEDDHQAFLLPIFDLMLQSQKSYDVNPTDAFGFSHFHCACGRNLVEVVEKFLNHDVDVNRVTYPFSIRIPGFTPLHFAIYYRCLEVLELLLKQDVNINAKTSKGATPLHLAVLNALNAFDIPLVETLLKYKPDVNATNIQNQTPLETYLLLPDYSMERIDILLKNGCLTRFVNTDINFYGYLGAVMIYSDSHDRKAIMKKLIEHSGVMKKAVEDGFNAILSVVKAPSHRRCTIEDYLEIFELFIEFGCDIDQKDKDGITALHGAVQHVNVEAIQALLQLGVDLKLDDDSPPIFPNVVHAANMPRVNDIRTLIAVHVWKMKYVGFDESEWNPIFGKEAVETYLSDNNVEESCRSEMVKMEETLITRTLNVKSFLSELKGVAEYPMLSLHRRYLVDEFFKKISNLHNEFPQLGGLLSYRYKHALARVELWKTARETLISIYPYFLPDICVDDILKYLENVELKVLIEMRKENSEAPTHISIDIPHA